MEQLKAELAERNRELAIAAEIGQSLLKKTKETEAEAERVKQEAELATKVLEIEREKLDSKFRATREQCRILEREKEESTMVVESVKSELEHVRKSSQTLTAQATSQLQQQLLNAEQNAVRCHGRSKPARERRA